ncbi:hypothetical protein HHI36_000671, partial [Cryptolaemus montrouzieri]
MLTVVDWLTRQDNRYIIYSIFYIFTKCNRTVELQRGNLILPIELFNKAIELARSEMEMTHLFSLRDAATSQLKVTTTTSLGITTPL